VRFGVAMEDHYRGFGIQHRTCIGSAIHAGAHVHAAVLDLPAPALDQVLGHETQMPVCEHGVEIVLISVELARDRRDVVLAKLLPDPAVSHGVPQHHAGVDAAPAGTPEMTEISHGPEIFRRQCQHPIYGSCYHGIEIEIQHTALYVLPIKHLHLVPPGFFASGYARPILQDMLDHGGRNRPIVLSEHMESHRAGEIIGYHVIEPFHIIPGVEIAVDHTGTIYGGMIYFAQLFFHWDIYQVMYADKYPYENHRTCNRRI